MDGIKFSVLIDTNKFVCTNVSCSMICSKYDYNNFFNGFITQLIYFKVSLWVSRTPQKKKKIVYSQKF